MTDSAGVRFPPPLLFAGFLALAVVLHRYLPLPQPPRTAVAVPAAICGVVAALLGFGAFFLFLALRQNPIPQARKTELVVRGPFRLTRNPMYLGLVLLYLALGLVWACAWTLLLLPVLLWILTARVIRREERYLETTFGDEYRAYRARVRRWL